MAIVMAAEVEVATEGTTALTTMLARDRTGGKIKSF